MIRASYFSQTSRFIMKTLSIYLMRTDHILKTLLTMSGLCLKASTLADGLCNGPGRLTVFLERGLEHLQPQTLFIHAS
jgi:hypothetical protein